MERKGKESKEKELKGKERKGIETKGKESLCVIIFTLVMPPSSQTTLQNYEYKSDVNYWQFI